MTHYKGDRHNILLLILGSIRGLSTAYFLTDKADFQGWITSLGAGKDTNLGPSPFSRTENKKLRTCWIMFLTWSQREFSSPAERRIKIIQNVTSLLALPSRAWSCCRKFLICSSEVLSFLKPVLPAGPPGTCPSTEANGGRHLTGLTPILVCEHSLSGPKPQQQIKERGQGGWIRNKLKWCVSFLWLSCKLVGEWGLKQ